MTKEEKGKFAFDRFIAGAKSDTARDYWYSKFKQELGQEVGQVVQVERMYSEEEVKKISLDFFYHWWNAKGNNTEEGFNDWFEQYKKK